jgi:uncharacterized protein YuzE
MKLIYDSETDALYIQLRELAPGTAQCRDLSEDITADYGPDGKLAGLEILDASVVLGTGPQGIAIELTPLVLAAKRHLQPA